MPIDRLKIWIAEKGKKPSGGSGGHIRKRISASDLDKPFEFDIWADFISDTQPRKKVAQVSFNYEEESTDTNKPPIANAGSDQNNVLHNGTIVTLNGTQSSDPEGKPLTYQWSQISGFKNVQLLNPNAVTTTFVAPSLDIIEPPPPPPTDPVAVLSVHPGLQVKSGTVVTLDAGESKNYDSLLLEQIGIGPSILLNQIDVDTWNFTAPSNVTTSLSFKLTATKEEGNVFKDTTVTIMVTKDEPIPPGGQIDQFGQIWLHATGEQFLIKQSRDEATDDRWSGNVTGVGLGYESMMIAKSIGTNSSSHFASKLYGGNHSGSGASSQRWYDLGVRVDGTIQLQWEGPHPNNHNFTLPDRCFLIKKLPKGDIENRWIGLKWMVYKVNGSQNGSPANGGVRVQMWINDDPIDTINNKVKNENWMKAIDFIDGVDVNVIDPQTFSAPDECDIEIRRSDTNDHEVWGGGQHIRRLGTFKPSALKLIKSETYNFDTNNEERERINAENRRLAKINVTDTKPCVAFDCPRNVTMIVEAPNPPFGDATTTAKDTNKSETLTFQLKVTDDKGLSATDTVNVIIVPELGQECPPDQHWDQVQQKCVPNEEPDGDEFIIVHVGDTHGEKQPLQSIVTKYPSAANRFILHSGDFTDTESDDDGYIQYLKDLSLTYGQDIANSQGNHESSEKEGGEGAQEDMETAFPVLKGNKWLQFYHIKNIVIIIGNTQLPNYSQLDSETSAHIQASLVKAKELKDQGKCDWIIYMQHKPMYIMSNSGHSAEYNFRYNFHPLFDQYGVDIMVSGHVHATQVTYPLIFGGEGTNVPPKPNKTLTANNNEFDMSLNPHGVICVPNGSSVKQHNFNESLNSWSVYAEDSLDSFTVFKIKGKKLTGSIIDVNNGNVLYEFKASKEGTIEPPTCPPGYHYDTVTKQCVPDSQPVDEVFKFNISGDFRDTPESGQNLISDQPDLILTTGDYGIAQNPQDWIDNVMNMWRDSNIETWGALGNHDDSQEYLDTKFFKNTSWSWSHKPNGTSLCFIAANTISENVSETDALLQQAQNDQQVKTIIVLMHEGIFHPPNTSVSSDTTLEFHNTFKKYSKVKMVVCGHTHVYGRMKPIDNILYVMNGIGGQSPSTGSTSPSPNHKINGALHCKLLLKDGSIKCECVPNAGDAPNIMDTFTIGPNGELPTDGVVGERRE